MIKAVIQTIMDYSVAGIGFITFIGLGISMARAEMKKRGTSLKGYLLALKANSQGLGDRILVKIVASISLSLLISFISFRELWNNDVFHIVFLSSLLIARTESLVIELFTKK